MSFGQFMTVLRARWLVAALVLALAVGITLAVSLILPPQYRATAAVVVEMKPDPISALSYPGGVAPAIMATQVDVMQSPRVAQTVTRMLRLTENPQIKQQWQQETGGEGSIEVWLGQLLQSRLDVIPSRESNVINLVYEAPDPRFAAAVANAFVQAFLSTTLELRVDPARQYTSFFENQSKDARDALEKAQAKLSAFQQQKGIIANDERFDVENAKLNELSSQVVLLQTLAGESRSRQAQALSGSGDRMAEVLNNGLISGLKADLSRGEARLQELSSRLGDKHPQVQEARANISELYKRIDAETRQVTQGVGVSNVINRQRESQVKADLETQRSLVLRMKAVRDEAAVLAREVDNAQRRYDAVLSRFTQTSLESQSTQSNINVLTQATAPLKPSSPRTLLNVALAFVLGSLLGMGAVLAVEMVDRRVRGPLDLDHAISLPLLGSIPKLGSSTGRRVLGGHSQLLRQRLLAKLPMATKG